MIITITSSDTKFDMEFPSYTASQAYVRDKIDVGLLLSDKDYQVVIDDILGRKKVDKFELLSEEYFYISEKYGRLNIDRLNRLLNK